MMKQKDLAILIAAVIVSAVISVVLSHLLFQVGAQSQQVEVVPSISANFPQPNKQFFNNNAIDPTQLIHINNYANANPFNGTTGTSQ